MTDTLDLRGATFHYEPEPPASPWRALAATLVVIGAAVVVGFAINGLLNVPRVDVGPPPSGTWASIEGVGIEVDTDGVVSVENLPVRGPDRLCGDTPYTYYSGEVEWTQGRDSYTLAVDGQDFMWSPGVGVLGAANWENTSLRLCTDADGVVRSVLLSH